MFHVHWPLLWNPVSLFYMQVSLKSIQLGVHWPLQYFEILYLCLGSVWEVLSTWFAPTSSLKYCASTCFKGLKCLKVLDAQWPLLWDLVSFTCFKGGSVQQVLYTLWPLLWNPTSVWRWRKCLTGTGCTLTSNLKFCAFICSEGGDVLQEVPVAHCMTFHFEILLLFEGGGGVGQVLGVRWTLQTHPRWSGTAQVGWGPQRSTADAAGMLNYFFVQLSGVTQMPLICCWSKHLWMIMWSVACLFRSLLLRINKQWFST